MKLRIKNLLLLGAIVLMADAASTEEPIDDEYSNEELFPSSMLADFLMATSMVGVSELGDKTFLIAALMAMRHPRLLVFSAATSSLALMTILSGLLGHIFTAMIPQSYTQFAAGMLFFIFGYKLTLEGLEIPKDAGVDGEMAEVDEEIAIQDMNNDLHNRESGGNKEKRIYVNNRNLNGILCDVIDFASSIVSPTWVQIFVMIFLGEFGDRSQISTIAMASGSNYWGVILGATMGHVVCTGIAVLGGKLLAKKISMRTVTLGGAFSFFIFGIVYTYEAFHNPN